MEGPSGNENPLQCIPWNSEENANSVSYVPGGSQNQHFYIPYGRSEKQNSSLPLPQRIHCQKTPCDYVEFLKGSSSFLQKTPTDEMLESIPASVGVIHAGNRVSDIPKEISYSKSEEASSSKSAYSSLDLDGWKVKFLRPHNEEPMNTHTRAQYQIHVQNHGSWTQESNEDYCNVPQVHPRLTVASPGFVSKSRCSQSNPRAATTDRRRRLRIAERLKALQELLPHSVQGSQASALDDIIDHIKYLQLQIKELSCSRLGGESVDDPLIFLEGYGHYIIHEQMLNEPLEEMMGKLLEVNPLAATQLLESKGLFVMPMTLADSLR